MPQQNDAPPLPTYSDHISRTEVAAMLKIKPTTLDKYVREGLIPHFTLPETTEGRRGQARFSRMEITKFIQERTVRA